MIPGSAVRPRSTVSKAGGPPPGTATFSNRDSTQIAIADAPHQDQIKPFLDEKLKKIDQERAKIPIHSKRNQPVAPEKPEFDREKVRIITRNHQDAAWKPGIRTTTFVSIWRVEKTKAVAWPIDLFGKFYDGDCYIILHGYNHPSGKKTTMLKYRLFVWLGGVVSSNEQIIGALVATDLERYLGYISDMYLEYQNKESDSFKHLFPDGTEIMEGSVGAGFYYVDPDRYSTDYVPIFFAVDAHYEHTSNLSVIKVSEENVYILDWGTTIFVYVGSVSHMMIQKAARLMTERIRFHRPTVHIIWNNTQAVKLIEECREVFKDFVKGPSALTSVRY